MRRVHNLHVFIYKITFFGIQTSNAGGGARVLAACLHGLRLLLDGGVRGGGQSTGFARRHSPHFSISNILQIHLYGLVLLLDGVVPPQRTPPARQGWAGFILTDWRQHCGSKILTNFPRKSRRLGYHQIYEFPYREKVAKNCFLVQEELVFSPLV